MSKKNEENSFRTTIGGQALMEGILMRGPKKEAIVCRGQDGLIRKVEELKLVKDRYPILGFPLIRGVVNFFDSLVHGVKALMYSAEQLPEEEQEAQEDKLDKWINAHFQGETAKKLIIGVSVALGVVMAVGLFMLLPYLLTVLLTGRLESSILKNLIDGLLRICIFLLYLWLVTRVPDIHRVFEYHGAEHKSIHCYEKGLELTVDNVRPQSRFHPRCGTSFLFVVVIISSLVTSLFTWRTVWVRLIIRLMLVPVVVGISYEINRAVGRMDNGLSRVLTAPGLFMQRFTTVEPDDSMIEVAIEAIRRVIPQGEDEDRW